MSGKTLFTCDKCGRDFNHVGNLRRHAKIHIHKDSPEGKAMLLTCDQCEYATFNGQNMRTHKYTHSNENQFICQEEECDFSCRSPSSLHRHRKIKHGYVSRMRNQEAKDILSARASSSNVAHTATTDVATPEFLLQPATRPDQYTAPAHSGSTSTFSDIDFPPPSPPRRRYRLRIEDLLNPESESD